MTLRRRLVVAVIFALSAGMALTIVMTVWQARQSVAIEIGAAIAVSRQNVSSDLISLENSPDRSRLLKRLIESFDGDRHVSATLKSANGSVLVQSSLAPPLEQVPNWFSRAIRGKAKTVTIPFSDGSIELETDWHSEVVEVWRSFKETSLVLAVMGAVTATVMWLVLGRALEPLEALSEALRRVGEGQLDARIPIGGPSEILSIADAFNHMAEDLSGARQRNLDLHLQLLNAQETERTEIARDLHDEVGALLFAINVDANTIEHKAAAEPASQAARSIRKTVQELRRRIRTIVNRLRPVGLEELGLGHALENLVEFWQRLRPDLDIRLDYSDGDAVLGELPALTGYRIVQEAVTNALRHGAPTRVTISAMITEGARPELLLSITDNGTGCDSPEPGFGLLSMRERVAAAGGRFTTSSIVGKGFIVEARLPLERRQPTMALSS